LRQLEIGPNKGRLPGFETLDIIGGPLVDHVMDCRKTSFPKDQFDLVYASHVIEHVQWDEVEGTIAEWVRILKPGGYLEKLSSRLKKPANGRVLARRGAMT
jgi:predicted SAM-dependent methyltransferase